MMHAWGDHKQALRAQHGLTLIELMIALSLGLVISIAMIAVLNSVATTDRSLQQWAQLQEAGRYALTRINQDLAMLNAQYCNHRSGDAVAPGWRGIQVHTPDLLAALQDVTTPWGRVPYPNAPTRSYVFPAFLTMRGYDCGLSSCRPVDPAQAGAALPRMGTALGQRVKGAAVLTMRYLHPSRGWDVSAPGRIESDPAGHLRAIHLNPGAGEPSLTALVHGQPQVLLADCVQAQWFSASLASGSLWPDGRNFSTPTRPHDVATARVFDARTDFETVTYYLKIVDNDAAGRTGALVRHGDSDRDGIYSDEELLRGVERLDFRYGVQDGGGRWRYLDAATLDASRRGDCPVDTEAPLGDDPGCLWRAVSRIEVSLLLEGQVLHYGLSPLELRYSYGPDGALTPVAPVDHVIAPAAQGFPLMRLRREFTWLVSVRNYNP